ncbi:MAG: hypothetical protein PWR02_1942 [Synergistales bacterium]|jgi:hypothetical protein|nr:hypothetical protein [Synergistales bacterium]
MTHSLHRYGSRESLKNDFCIYARAAKGINRDKCGDKLRKILAIFRSENVVNFGSSHSGKSYAAGLDPDAYAESLDNSYGVIASFDSREAVTKVLKKLKEADIGISIVVSGLIDEVTAIASECGLTPHTATLSLGIYGNRSLLPEDEVLELTTMCGHSLVGSNLARSAIEKVKNGIMSPEEAAKLMAKPCTCGIFNTSRCVDLLKKQLEKISEKGPETNCL